MPIGAFKLNSISAAASAPAFVDTYWFAHAQGSAVEDRPYVYVDTNSNVYAMIQTGSTTLIGGRDIYVWKRNAEGTVQWTRRIGDTTPKSFTAYGITADSTGNAYILFGTTNYEVYCQKIDTSGSITYSKQVKGSNTYYSIFGNSNTNIATDGTYVHINGYQGNSTYDQSVVTLNCSDLTHVRCRQLTAGTGETAVSGIWVDTSGNYFTQMGDGLETIFAKYNSSGTLQWQKNFDATSLDRMYGIVTDSSGNIYMNYNTSSYSCLSKISSDGSTVNWTKTSDDNTTGGHIATDGTNIYWVNNTGYTNGGWSITKFNSSGTTQWQRQIYAASGANAYRYCWANAYAVVVGARQTFTNNDGVQFKIPLDGTKTGTYSLGGKNFTYTSMSLTLGTAVTPTTSTSSATTGTSAGSSTNYSSYTSNTTALTYNLVTLT